LSDFRPCRECRDWDRCLLTESEKHWFGYQHIRFCKHHVFFLLKNRDIIRGRAWPNSDEALGGSSTQTLSDAAWVSVSLLLAELDTRLDKTSIKGELLAEQCVTREKMAYLSAHAKEALLYISGWRRKETPFNVWLATRRYRKYNRPQKVHV